jgi:hypothetical protein
MTSSGMALLGLVGGSIQIGSYVFSPEDADKIAAFIADSKKLRTATDATNTSPKKANTKTDTA